MVATPSNPSRHEPNFAQPWAPHRLKIYTWTGIFTFGMFLAVTVGVSFGVIPPTFTTDVVVNLIFGIPVILLPFVIFWNAPGEQRTRLDKAAELTLFYLPYTAGSQIGYELMFLIGHPLGLWAPTTDPGWKWLWWQYALADTRYVSGNPWIFALDIVGASFVRDIEPGELLAIDADGVRSTRFAPPSPKGCVFE
ncbi:hypothetical protein H7I76_16995, partial [Mycolicibacterium vaccae]|nr:hypothetical protein [Mycolicibacterium vaccae]